MAHCNSLATGLRSAPAVSFVLYFFVFDPARLIGRARRVMRPSVGGYIFSPGSPMSGDVHGNGPRHVVHEIAPFDRAPIHVSGVVDQEPCVANSGLLPTFQPRSFGDRSVDEKAITEMFYVASGGRGSGLSCFGIDDSCGNCGHGRGFGIACDGGNWGCWKLKRSRSDGHTCGLRGVFDLQHHRCVGLFTNIRK